MEDDKVEYRIVPDRPTILLGTDGTAWQRLEQRPNPNGYMRITVGKYRPGMRQERLYVYHLMLRTFRGVKPEGLLCRHLDDDPANNRLENLAYGTWQDNADDRVRNGSSTQGSGVHCAKLHESQIPEIRRLAAEGVSRTEIGRRFGVGQPTISDIVLGVTWKHVTADGDEPT